MARNQPRRRMRAEREAVLKADAYPQLDLPPGLSEVIPHDPGGPALVVFRRPGPEEAREIITRYYKTNDEKDRRQIAERVLNGTAFARPVLDQIVSRANPHDEPRRACVRHQVHVLAAIVRALPGAYHRMDSVADPWELIEHPVQDRITEIIIAASDRAATFEYRAIKQVLRSPDPVEALRDGVGSTCAWVIWLLGLGETPAAVADLYPHPVAVTRAALARDLEDRIAPTHIRRALCAEDRLLEVLCKLPDTERALWMTKFRHNGYRDSTPGYGFADITALGALFGIKDAKHRASRAQARLLDAWWSGWHSAGREMGT